MSKLTESQEPLNGGVGVGRIPNKEYSEGQILTKRITVPGSEFEALWNADKGYSVGLEGCRLTLDYETLEEALNQVGYGVEKDADGDEILVRVETPINYEMVVRIVRALIIVSKEDGKENL